MIKDAAPTKEMPGVCIYIMQTRDGRIKVGRTGNIKRRLAWLQAMEKTKLRVVATFPEAGGHERYMLSLLRNHQMDGAGREWFRNTAPVRAAIAEAFEINQNLFNVPWGPERSV